MLRKASRRRAVKPLNNVQTGTLGGTLCSIFGNLNVGDVLTTALLAALGAVVSFVVSSVLSALSRKWRDIQYSSGEGLHEQEIDAGFVVSCAHKPRWGEA